MLTQARARLAAGIVAVAAVAAPLLAAPPLTKAMVLSAHGARFLTLKGAQPEPLSAGKVLVERNQVAVDGGGEVILLDLSAGKRLQTKGATLIEVGPDGLQAKTGKLLAAAGPDARLTASGDNFRRLGGAQLRDIEPGQFRQALDQKPIQQSDRYRGLETDCSSPRETVLTFQLEKGETTFLGVDVEIYAVTSNFNAVYQDGAVKLATSPEHPLYQTRALADRDETTYHVQLDRETFIPGSYRLRIAESQCGLDIRTGFRIFGSTRLAGLEEAAKQRNAYFAQNPQDCPSLLAATVALQELYKLDEAHRMLARARALDPENHHLRNWDFELLLDSGHYGAALRTLAGKS